MFGQEFIVSRQSPIASQIAKCPLDHPAARDQNKAGEVIGTFDNLQVNSKGLFDPTHQRPTVATVCPDFLEGREALDARFEQGAGSVTVGLVGGRNKDFQNAPACIYKQMAFASFDFFVAIVADVVGTGLPPFSVVFTD